MALKLVKLDDTTLMRIADAIRAKTGGTELMLPSEMAEAIAGIPTGGELPELTTPAVAAQVLAGKEYIDASGAKQTGTLVVMETVAEVETVGIDGTGLSVDLESSADASQKTIVLAEPNLTAENIKSGVSIFGVTGAAGGGAASNINGADFECGVFTLAEDITTVSGYTVNHNLGVVPSAVFLWVVDPSVSGAMVGKFKADSTSLYNAISILMSNNGSIASGSGANAGAYRVNCTDAAIVFPASETYPLKAGLRYQWLAIGSEVVSNG